MDARVAEGEAVSDAQFFVRQREVLPLIECRIGGQAFQSRASGCDMMASIKLASNTVRQIGPTFAVAAERGLCGYAGI